MRKFTIAVVVVLLGLSSLAPVQAQDDGADPNANPPAGNVPPGEAPPGDVPPGEAPPQDQPPVAPPNQGDPNQGVPNQGVPNQGVPNQGNPNQPNPGVQADPQAILAMLLNSIQANDYAAFAVVVSDTVRANIPKEMFDQVVAQFAPRMNAGYEMIYLGDIKKGPMRIYLAKLVFQDQGDDFMVEMALMGPSVEGFFLR